MAALLALCRIGIARAETLIVYGSDRFPPISCLEAWKPEEIFPRFLQRPQAETGDTYDIRLVPWARVMRREGRRYILDIEAGLRGKIDQFPILPKAMRSAPLHLVHLNTAGKKPAIERLRKAFLRLKARGAFNNLLVRP